MKEILFDGNFKNNSFLEQMHSALFKACAKVSEDYKFTGFCSENVVEEFSSNVRFFKIPFGNFYNLWQNTVIPVVALSKKNIPFYFPCGNIPGFLPTNAPIISLVKDVFPIESKGYFTTEEDEKNYRRQMQTDLNRSDLIFVTSEHVKNVLQQEFLVQEEPVVLSYASLIPDEYIDLPLARNNEEYFFVEVENISHKGLNEILKDFIYLHTTGKSSLRLYLSGKIKSTNKELMINMQVARKFGAIREYENLSAGQRATLLRGAIAALIPSTTDVLPIAHLDAMKCSCPVITDSTPAVKEACQDAVIYADIRETSIYNNVLHLIQRDENYRNEYIQKGREREKHFYWNNSAQTFIEKIELSIEHE